MDAGSLANPLVRGFHGLRQVVVGYDPRWESRSPASDDTANGVSRNSWHANEP